MTDREIYNKQPFFLEPRRHSDREVHREITAKAFRRKGMESFSICYRSSINQQLFFKPQRHSDTEVHREITAKALRWEGTKAKRHKDGKNR